MQDNDFLKGTVILGFSGVVVKILSAAYRIPLTRMIGAEGMGRYAAAFNIFMPFFSLATAGITPTVSRLRAINTAPGDAVVIRRRACTLFGIVSRLLICRGLATSYIYAGYMGSAIIFAGVALLCPNLFFATFEAVYKGISQGTMNMKASAKAGVLESSAKIIIGLSGVYFTGMMVQNNPVDAQLIWAFTTVSISGLICFVFLHRDFKRSYRGAQKTGLKITASALLSMAVPISLSALVVSLSNSADTMVSLSIVKNFSDRQLMAAYPFISFTAVEEKAIWLFGVYQGLCLSVVNLIPSLSAAIGASGLPLLTKAVNTGNKASSARQINRLVRFTAAISVPAAMFVMFFSWEVIYTLYGDEGASTLLASNFLKYMAPVAVLSAFSFPLNSVLHSEGKSSSILKILIISRLVKVVLSVGLCSIPRINIMGCMISTMVFHTLVFLLSLNSIRGVYPAKNLLGNIVYPAMLSYVLLTFMRALADFVLYNIPTGFTTIFCGVVFVVVYLCLLVFMGFFVDK